MAYQRPYKGSVVLLEHSQSLIVSLRAFDYLACILTSNIFQYALQLILSRRLFSNIKVKLCPDIGGLRFR